MEKLSSTEQVLYDYIKGKKQVTYDEIKKDLGNKFIGASGKLIQKELVEKTKKLMGEQKTGYGRYGSKWIKTLKIKGVK